MVTVLNNCKLHFKSYILKKITITITSHFYKVTPNSGYYYKSNNYYYILVIYRNHKDST